MLIALQVVIQYWESSQQSVGYYFSRIIFGLKSSGFILSKSIRVLLIRINDQNYLHGNQDLYNTALILYQSMYVDDFVASISTEKECEVILKNAIYIFKLAHFDIKKIFSNSKKLMNSIFLKRLYRKILHRYIALSA